MIDHTQFAMEVESLSKPFSSAEVIEALKRIKGRKAPSPDGLQAYFLQKYWNILGTDVTNMVLGILNNREHINAFNDTNIALIPRVKFPTSVKDFRLIGLCNVIYKLVSKVIVNWLKPLLPSVVHDIQSAFVEK